MLVCECREEAGGYGEVGEREEGRPYGGEDQEVDAAGGGVGGRDGGGVVPGGHWVRR